MTTLRRERIGKFKEILDKYYVDFQCNESVAALLADAAESNSEKKKQLAGMSIECAIRAGVDVDQDMADLFALRENATRSFEEALGFSTSLPWGNNSAWMRMQEWVVERYKENSNCFKEYKIWSDKPFVRGAIGLPRIRTHPLEFIDSWDAFKQAKAINKTDKYSSIRQELEALANGNTE